ncbi:MAG TPA: sulfite exporter TauE/SafE family protein [Sphingobium sp.]|nr:sulfite exporter TauE/SafE family protein [Sphingobium sp.]
MLIPTDPASLFLIFASLALLGLAKGGFAGIGTVSTPLLAMVFPPVEAAAIVLPLLIVQDAVSVWLFRHSWNGRIIAWMLPGAIIGIAAAALFSAVVSVRAVMAALGAISILFGLWQLWVAWHRLSARPLARGEWPGVLFGMISGFTSQIAHAGSPPYQMWVVPRKLPHLEYVGTTAILFGLVNWAKVPAFIALGEFTPRTLLISAMFIPVATLSTFAGSWLVRRVKGAGFYLFANALLIPVGMKLIWDAFA